MDLNIPVRCPKGHLSTDTDYCSECGSKMSATPSGLDASSAASSPFAGLSPNMPSNMPSQAASTLTAAQSGSSQLCPDCGTPRSTPTATFCEVCRYNFVTATSWGSPKVAVQPIIPVPVADTPPISPAPPIVADSVTAPPLSLDVAVNIPSLGAMTSSDDGIILNPVAPTVDLPYPAPPPISLDGTGLRWEARLTVDPSLNTDPDPDLPCPVGEPERIFPLDFAESLIGRRSERRGIFPEINVNDPCVSHRHARLLRQSDGSFALLDLGSTNGTMLNGVEVKPNVLQPLKDGDQITLGCWTRIVLHGLRS